jgi:hypothetical protein
MAELLKARGIAIPQDQHGENKEEE